MNSNGLVFNMLVAQEKINSGLTQLELFDYIVDMGFNNIELRREYFKDIDSEITAITKFCERNKITIFYSVPDAIFLDSGKLNPAISQYFDEAKKLKATHIKMTIGNYQEKAQLQNLKLINQQAFNFMVENDQTQQSGTIKNILSFLNDTTAIGLNIGYTYDLGNFRYVGENEVTGAEVLKPYISYIHLKNVSQVQDTLVATSLDQGDIDWKQVLSRLPKDVPVALEYPSNQKVEILTDKQLIEVFGYGN
ncbi:sugar phosphate isomerase [Staphylococcus casei]|uniref:sugar phosphate isomerase/epimerase family protein n=1 Tax=Staphylococcus TaxID=1279 RepID=UPI000CD1C5F0|nr:TIM barrel protein [Staphylococcus casei]PNZ62771.1 sugar phosphate isomerase [Staphylococcus casei]WJE86362.1 sugar phosphate isomerase/epimerase [Staphylococcus casei]